MATHDYKYLANAEEDAMKYKAQGFRVQIKQVKLGRYPWRLYVNRK
jgi:hypothetical protein